MEEGDRKQKVRERQKPEKDISSFAGFEDEGMVPDPKKCKWPLKGEKGEKTDSSLEPPEEIQVCGYLDFIK